jgi:hypothetical protein
MDRAGSAPAPTPSGASGGASRAGGADAVAKAGKRLRMSETFKAQKRVSFGPAATPNPFQAFHQAPAVTVSQSPLVPTASPSKGTAASARPPLQTVQHDLQENVLHPLHSRCAQSSRSATAQPCCGA